MNPYYGASAAYLALFSFEYFKANQIPRFHDVLFINT